MGADRHVDDANPPMYISQEELNKTQIPLVWRDYCAHLLPELNQCRRDTYFAPWHCTEEKLAWKKCQYDDFVRRVRKLDKRKEAQEAARKAATASEV
ncbi:hypothetical protein BASA50_006556 [Batrachochytrium salamandrivorans]|uniref:NADH dehydrogenase [ubiquinone] 1 beta subcomplex subunit 7 n=1 Tax=Batrachochytrium salamandrivorans TaxID=1357716 RepID=A0ABQ8FCQ1_9FUNG|nr:hypothetical protein BASA62_009204 [Batrachochytrium salamandrivorans]KAH6577212.1 hypothetical protein BASA60_004147 [Batrachochytrium salamandrivorans]KAH6582899.1 hypothetical protein BASA61_008311 [Batrachochytrium salamandrivorans]KAH6594607.1 hypothetical protein BASA50_006556 [Batrachochytrium salamandrivorans]KAH9252499.1 hypothetical protein BASA81_009542 [Batrachochytrium salamandrivorans]